MLNRRQAIIWTDADTIHWRIYVAMGGDELTQLIHDMVYSLFPSIWFITLNRFVVFFLNDALRRQGLQYYYMFVYLRDADIVTTFLSGDYR